MSTQAKQDTEEYEDQDCISINSLDSYESHVIICHGSVVVWLIFRLAR